MDTPKPAATSSKKQVIVLGAGVIGLTTAYKLQLEDAYQVIIVSDIVPSDPKSIKYASRWAGAHHVYNPINETEQHMFEEQTFDVMWALSAPGSDAEECFLRVPQTEYFHVEPQKPNPMEKMPNFRHLKPEELIPGAVCGLTFTTLTIDVPIYLNYLLMRFLAAGGRIVRGSLQHIYPLLEAGATLFAGGNKHDPLPDAVINCTGLGARTLGGVEDKDVFPVRGQTVLVRAPWVRFGRTETLDKTGAFTYIIPRRSSDVIVGGTRGADDWFPRPRPETTEDILRRGLKLCPELAPPEIRAIREPTLDDILPHVVAEGCGLRPARKGGVRIEVELIDGALVKREGKIPIVHNYGHGGFGYQASWGCAKRVVELLDSVLAPTKEKP